MAAGERWLAGYLNYGGGLATLPLESEQVKLVWTRRALARSYTLDAAYDAAFTQLGDY